ncbi:MAG: peroxiredoxin [Burkholderiales bacterium]|jgi:peroxiredoxin Q/BCP|nr:peroxiredoxin [Burkholderiales bacterium]
MTDTSLFLPDLTLASTRGDIALHAPRKDWLLLYFYPRDNTPGCAKEALQFAAVYPRFRKQNVEILGVSRDSVASHHRFREKYALPFDLISDADEKLSSHFGVIKNKILYGKKFRGIERSTFLIDNNLRVTREWRNVKADGHAEETLAWIKDNIK